MMASTVLNFVNTTLDWVTHALDAPSASAIVFGFNIGGNFLALDLIIFYYLLLFSI
jgi:serine palmitoyltransferase